MVVVGAVRSTPFRYTKVTVSPFDACATAAICAAMSASQSMGLSRAQPVRPSALYLFPFQSRSNTRHCLAHAGSMRPLSLQDMMMVDRLSV